MKKVIKKLGSPKGIKRMKICSFAFVAVLTVLAYSGVAFAAQQGADINTVVNPVLGLINSLVNPLLLLVGAGGAVYAIILGFKYATAEEPQEREKRKQSIKSFLIGYVLIFVLLVVLKLGIPVLNNWMTNSTANAGSAVQTATEAQ
ncbi:MAG: hypothetical protein IJ661_06340 [Lachnospiraceae bacterium]|nr:hypothetical protein [Lachnospiraceae bacterium]